MSQGRFVWYDIYSTDLPKTKAFFTELFNWSAEPSGDQGYEMIKAGETYVGGFMAIDASMGTPSHMMGYCTVEDVDASVKKWGELGARTLVPPTDIPTIGRFAIIADPQGAAVALFSSPSEDPPEVDTMPAPGTICWRELMTSDPAGAKAFYGEIFGWTAEDSDMGEVGIYTIFKRGERMESGCMKTPPAAGEEPPNWLYYITTESVDETTKRAESLGATTYVPPTDIPNVGRFSVLADPTGCAFAPFEGSEPTGK